ncbi:hypothetical protein SEA_WOLLYPOG_68 [Arthrobacter phage Wollypog]|uniref:Uncharacterized protein n=1 Tax=Arthrobacter phage Wollypog TaxID=2790985 RepID=A0A7T3KCA7_9CAUD|nr:hypothetical protein PP291_gp68 [Arthrobacter phage Wollypog]QPX62618.1 hypothetical protein SEA_WOLLYPOG_68 [Arthrobacter phage Wollypog]
MTIYRTKANRAIARSRGHLKQAEQDFTHENYQRVSFAIAKSGHTLQVGMLHEAERAAEAQEMRTVLEILKEDPEGEVGSLLDMAEFSALEVKFQEYVRKITGREEESDD